MLEHLELTMEKRKWPWKKKSSERSPGESGTSGSVSSHSERDSDDQPESTKESPNHEIESPEVTSKIEMDNEDVNNSIRSLTEKLSAALVNVSAKDDLVKQHAKVAEEAVAGWEKAENEVAELKQKLEDAVNKNSVLEDRISHLDGALKECVRQLRQARDEQETKIQEAVREKTHELEYAKTELENQILQFQNEAEFVKPEIPSDLTQMVESLGRENLLLKHELLSQSEELEIRTIERDLSTHAAETASKQHLESIKKVAKLEAECRRLRGLACKSSKSVNDHRSTDSQSDGGERPEASCSDSWASALIAELDQFKNEKSVLKSLPGSSSIEINLMDDFLEMEKLAALTEIENENLKNKSELAVKQSSDAEISLRAEIEVLIGRTKELEEKLEKIEAEKIELENEVKKSKDAENSLKCELEALVHEKMELEEKLEKMEVEKAELEIACDISKDKYEESQVRLREVEMKLEEIQKELNLRNESKKKVESQIISLEAEARTMSSKIESLDEDVRKERAFSAELKDKYQELEEELWMEKQEAEVRQNAASNGEPKIKQEDLAAAAGKLAECQKTIASLGKQLQSLATLEDFLIDTANIPGLSGAVSSNCKNVGEKWRLPSNESFSPRDSEPKKTTGESSSSPLVSKNNGNSPPSASSVVSSNQGSSEKNRNGFAKFFTRSKTGIQLEI